MPLLKISGNKLEARFNPLLDEVSIDDWRANASVHGNALVIESGVDVSKIEGDINAFATIILEFPTFKDGRAYSQARMLRERLGYSGELRARGNILRDQILYMARCGFDAFEFEGAVKSAEEALTEFSVYYQGASDHRQPVWQKRRSRAAAA